MFDAEKEVARPMNLYPIYDKPVPMKEVAPGLWVQRDKSPEVPATAEEYNRSVPLFAEAMKDKKLDEKCERLATWFYDHIESLAGPGNVPNSIQAYAEIIRSYF